MGLIEPAAVVLEGAEPVRLAQQPVDGRVLAAKVAGAADVVVAGGRHEAGDVGVRAVRALGHAVEPLVHHADGLDLAPRAARREGVGPARQHLIAALEEDPDVVVAVLGRLAFILAQLRQRLGRRPLGLFQQCQTVHAQPEQVVP